MALERQISRLSKMLVDSEGLSFDDAQQRLKSLTLEIVVGDAASSPAAHCAILTAIAVGRRSFIGGVRVVGLLDQPLNTSLPLTSTSLREAAIETGAATLDGPASQTIFIGCQESRQGGPNIHLWWNGWQAGAGHGLALCDAGQNPLTGITAGALGVGMAFQAAKQNEAVATEIDLWLASENGTAPEFSDSWLPGAVWIVGLGNLGQAFLWALSALPYSDPGAVSLILQDRDRVSEENWATSILVRDEVYGCLKTRIAEDWALQKGFAVRRVDRFLTRTDRLHDGDPRLALSGVDSVEARKIMAETGFDCIVDTGLGRTARNYDRMRVTVFDQEHSIAEHFNGQMDVGGNDDVPNENGYKLLEEEIGQCGAAEVAGTSIAASYVSAIAACCAIARLIGVTSGLSVAQNEVHQLSQNSVRRARSIDVNSRRLGHAGRPKVS